MYNPTRVPIQITVNAKAPVASLANTKVAIANISDGAVVGSAVTSLSVNLPLQKIASTNYTNGLLETAVANNTEIINLIEAVVEVDTTGYGVFSSTSLFAQNYNFTKTEIANAIELCVKDLRKSAMEQLSIGQLLNKTLGKKATESIASSESLKKFSANSRTDILHITEVLIKVATQYRSLVDSTALSEKVSKASSKIALESTGIQLLYMHQLLKATIDNTSISEFKKINFSKIKVETTALAESLLRALVLNRSLIENSNLTENRKLLLTKNIAEATSLIEGLNRNISRLSIENINTSDKLSKVQYKTFNDALSLVETLTKTLSTAGLVLSLNESLLNSETLVKALSHISAEASALVESLVRSFSKSLKDQTGISEFLNRNISRLSIENINTSDKLSKVQYKTFNDALSLVETLTTTLSAVAGLVLALNESLLNSEILIKSVGHISIDTSALAEIFAKSYFKMLSESTIVSDKLVKAAVKINSETTSITASCSIIMQNYGSSDYFAGDFVGISKTL